MTSISFDVVRLFWAVLVGMALFAASVCAAEPRIVDGVEVREAIIKRLAAAGEAAAPSLLPQKQFYLCDAPLIVEPTFGGWRSVNVICPSPAKWQIAVRSQVKGAQIFNPVPNVAADLRAVFLTRPLRRGDRIQPGDVEMRPIETLSTGSIYASIDQVMGRLMDQSLTPQIALMPRHLAREWSVEEDDILALRIVRGGIEILSTGVALETGQFGDIIRVENARSGKVLLGKVTGEKKVEIIAKGRE